MFITILTAFDFLPHFCSGVSIHMTIHNSRLKGDTMSLMTSQCHFGCFADTWTPPRFQPLTFLTDLSRLICCPISENHCRETRRSSIIFLKSSSTKYFTNFRPPSYSNSGSTLACSCALEAFCNLFVLHFEFPCIHIGVVISELWKSQNKRWSHRFL